MIRRYITSLNCLIPTTSHTKEVMIIAPSSTPSTIPKSFSISRIAKVEENKDILKPGYDKQQDKQQQENESIKDSAVIENKDRITSNVKLSQQQDITRFKVKKGLKIKSDFSVAEDACQVTSKNMLEE